MNGSIAGIKLNWKQLELNKMGSETAQKLELNKTETGTAQ